MQGAGVVEPICRSAAAGIELYRTMAGQECLRDCAQLEQTARLRAGKVAA